MVYKFVPSAGVTVAAGDQRSVFYYEKIAAARQRNIHLKEMGRKASLAEVQRARTVLLHDDGYSKRWFSLKI
jgi:hypothetical protein